MGTLDSAALLQELGAFVPTDAGINLHYFSSKASSKLKDTDESSNIQSHFYAITQNGCLTFAIELLCYTTKEITTIYVAKVDSTGYRVPQSSLSWTKVTTAILIHLIRSVVTKRVRVSLFARSQPQYLFPYSSKNSQKNILDDRSLIKWWANCLDAIRSRLEIYDTTVVPYMLMPGWDYSEMTAYLPNKGWKLGSPYIQSALVKHEVPQFSDDPKGRFLDELRRDGQLERITVAEFWELMAFRQECASGRAIGFLSLECLFKGQRNPRVKVAEAEVMTVFGAGALSKNTYKRIVDDLMQGNYATQRSTEESTERWENSLARILTSEYQSLKVKGTHAATTKQLCHTEGSNSVEPTIIHAKAETVLNLLVPRKKRKKQT